MFSIISSIPWQTIFSHIWQEFCIPFIKESFLTQSYRLICIHWKGKATKGLFPHMVLQGVACFLPSLGLWVTNCLFNDDNYVFCYPHHTWIMIKPAFKNVSFQMCNRFPGSDNGITKCLPMKDILSIEITAVVYMDSMNSRHFLCYLFPGPREWATKSAG